MRILKGKVAIQIGGKKEAGGLFFGSRDPREKGIFFFERTLRYIILREQRKAGEGREEQPHHHRGILEKVS